MSWLTPDEHQLMRQLGRELYSEIKRRSSGKYDTDTKRPLNADWLVNFDALVNRVIAAKPEEPDVARAALKAELLAEIVAELPALIRDALAAHTPVTRGIRFSEEEP